MKFKWLKMFPAAKSITFSEENKPEQLNIKLKVTVIDTLIPIVTNNTIRNFGQTIT